MGLNPDEFYSMTPGNFSRRSLGFIKNRWIVSREIISAIYATTGNRVTGEEVFPFGLQKERKEATRPTEEDREQMRKRHEYIINHGRQEAVNS